MLGNYLFFFPSKISVAAIRTKKKRKKIVIKSSDIDELL